MTLTHLAAIIASGEVLTLNGTGLSTRVGWGLVSRLDPFLTLKKTGIGAILCKNGSDFIPSAAPPG